MPIDYSLHFKIEMEAMHYIKKELGFSYWVMIYWPFFSLKLFTIHSFCSLCKICLQLGCGDMFPSLFTYHLLHLILHFENCFLTTETVHVHLFHASALIINSDDTAGVQVSHIWSIETRFSQSLSYCLNMTPIFFSRVFILYIKTSRSVWVKQHTKATAIASVNAK